MMVYAQDMATWEWASVKTEAADGEASYTLTVKPGSYVIFAFADDGSGSYAGYPTVDGLMLGTVTVAAGQTVTDVNLIPPSQSECGSLWGAPPSPDGRFASVSPSGACLAEKAASGAYQPVSAEVCQIIKESADQALSVSFYMIPNDTFTDPVTGETGLGCTLKAAGTVSMFGNPNQVVTKLKNAFGGWEEKTSYQASGPTGEATAMTRDMGLMLINAGWEPAPEIQCPVDQPIAACNLEDDMKLYTILIQVAQK
jgi:hypothetical protein